MTMIIVCHFFQYYGNPLAWWFNVGVQVFLFISGYLYGQKTKIDPIPFIKKNFYKILLDFLVYIGITYLFLVLILQESISLKLLLKQVLCIGYLPGLKHLWYIPCILLCYLLTPFFSEIDCYLRKQDRFYLFKLALILFCVQVIGLYYTRNINSVWIICYAFGFYFSRYFVRNKKENVFYAISIVLCIILNLLIATSFGGYLLSTLNIYKGSLLYSLIDNYGHIFLGVTIFTIIYKAIPSKVLVTKPIILILGMSDKYSYDIYLVHQFLIFGSTNLCILSIINDPILGILIVVMLISFSAAVLRTICKCISKLILRRVVL